MSTSFAIDEIAGELSKSNISSIACVLDERIQVVSIALSSLIPTVLSSLLLHCKEGGTATVERIISSTCDLGALCAAPNKLNHATTMRSQKELWSIITRNPSQTIKEALIPGTPTSCVLSQLISQLFGPEWSKIVRMLTLQTGAKPASLMAMTGVVTPLALHWVARQASKAKLPHEMRELVARGRSLSADVVGAYLEMVANDINAVLPMHLASILASATPLTTTVTLSSVERSGRKSEQKGDTQSSNSRLPKSFRYSKRTERRSAVFGMALFLLIGSIFYLWNVPNLNIRNEFAGLSTRVASASTKATLVITNYSRVASDLASSWASSFREGVDHAILRFKAYFESESPRYSKVDPKLGDETMRGMFRLENTPKPLESAPSMKREDS